MFPVFCLQDELVACSSNNSVEHSLHSPIRAHAICHPYALNFCGIGRSHKYGGVHNDTFNIGIGLLN